MENDFSDYVVYVDESGDHGLVSIDPQYPIFVLVFCIFHKQSYLSTVQKVQKFKFDNFGHDLIVLHESDIRRDRGDFKILKSRERKEIFINKITNIIEEEEFIVIASVIDKSKLKQKYTSASNPYHIALEFCIERLYLFLKEKGDINKSTHIVFEKRGQNEDDELELEFRRICDRNNLFNKTLPFIFVKAHKQSNSSGLQFADLLARPIGLSILKPTQDNRAFEIIKQKLRCCNGITNRYGLKVFP
ncbi:MAG: DUF3800 domain-containing protein [Methylococcaceae bacterium]